MTAKYVVLAALALVLSLGPPIGMAQQPAASKTHLKVGDMAPDFTIPDQNGKAIKLSEFRGKQKVVVAFYVLAFTGG
jgi:cytochrome oxidase Cu insertion factor (SCO1/SenC/PrrC family)